MTSRAFRRLTNYRKWDVVQWCEYDDTCTTKFVLRDSIKTPCLLLTLDREELEPREESIYHGRGHLKDFIQRGGAGPPVSKEVFDNNSFYKQWEGTENCQSVITAPKVPAEMKTKEFLQPSNWEKWHIARWRMRAKWATFVLKNGRDGNPCLVVKINRKSLTDKIMFNALVARLKGGPNLWNSPYWIELNDIKEEFGHLTEIRITSRRRLVEAPRVACHVVPPVQPTPALIPPPSGTKTAVSAAVSFFGILLVGYLLLRCLRRRKRRGPILPVWDVG